MCGEGGVAKVQCVWREGGSKGLVCVERGGVVKGWPTPPCRESGNGSAGCVE